SLPGRDVPRDHRRHRRGTHLRRLSRRRARYGFQPNLRRQNPTAGVCPQSADCAAGYERGFLTSPTAFLPERSSEVAVSASVLYMSMSLDGYIAGPNDEPGNPGGDGGAVARP